MSKTLPKSSAVVLSLAKKASRKRIAADDDGDFEESTMESIVEYGPTAPKVKNIVSGKDLMDNFGGSTKIYKQHLPYNTLFEVTNLRTVDVHGTDQAVYMDAKIVMQAADEEDNDEDAQEATEGVSIVTSNFTDFNGADINDLIQCTAPRSIAKSWLTGGITKEHIENTILFMINESYDRDHEANKFMQNVHFNYQYYFGADLTADVVESLREGNVESSDAFKAFFVSCLDLSAEFKKRNEKYCKATERYAADKPQRANVKRAVSCAFK